MHYHGAMETPPSEFERIRERIWATYDRWGIPQSFAIAPQTADTLSDMLDEAERRIPEMQCRLFPSRFDPDDARLRAFPRPIQWHWSSAERILRHFGAQVVMTRLPHFWQLESPIHLICRNVGAPLFTNEVENVPVAAAAIVSANVDAVITASTSVQSFATFLTEHAIEIPKLWLLILDASADDWSVPGSLTGGDVQTAMEIHLSPGVPILYQCPHLAADKKPRFHMSDDYLWQLESNTYITSIGGDPVPLYRYTLPCTLVEQGLCHCGRMTVSKML